MPLENFFDKKKARNYYSLERGSNVARLCVTIAVCNEQLPVRLVIAATASCRALALDRAYYSLYNILIINNSLTIVKIAIWYKVFLFSLASSMLPITASTAFHGPCMWT